MTVLPSVYDDVFGGSSDRPELLGGVLQESLASGTPVICTDVGGMPEVVRDGENGFTVPPNDPPALTDRIGRLAADPALRRRLGRGRARRRALLGRGGARDPGPLPRMSLHVCTIVTPGPPRRARGCWRGRCASTTPRRAAPRSWSATRRPRASRSRCSGLEQLDCPPLEEMLAAYEPFALTCALKPWLLLPPARARARPCSTSTPTSASTRRSTTRCAAARRHGLVLTRHLLGPLPRDGRHPSEEDILLAGAFNAGFLGAGPRPTRALPRPGGRSGWREDCTIDPARGLFLDQRWLDLAPGLVPGPCCATRAATSASGTCRTAR